MAKIISIKEVGNTAKITYDNNEILYSWNDGRYKISADNDTIEVVNGKLAPEDKYHQQIFKFSEQTQNYGATSAVEFVEYIILNGIFFSDVSIVETKSLPESVKITEVGDISYIASARTSSLQSSPVWKVFKLDKSVAGTTTKTYADDGNYSQVATDLTTLTYV